MIKKKVEADLLRRFSKKVGDPSQTNIFFGDGSTAFFSRLRGHGPSFKSVGTIRLLHQFGYSVYMVDESYTSKR